MREEYSVTNTATGFGEFSHNLNIEAPRKENHPCHTYSNERILEQVLHVLKSTQNFITISYHSTLSSSRGYRYLQVTSARTQGYRCSHKRRGKKLHTLHPSSSNVLFLTLAFILSFTSYQTEKNNSILVLFKKKIAQLWEVKCNEK